MKIHFITYGCDKFKSSKDRIINEAISSRWFDSCTAYSPLDLSESFRQKHSHILDKKRGGGFYIWKFDIIQTELNKLDEGDILIYIDAGCTINPNGKERLNKYINDLTTSNYGIISFESDWLEKQYTTTQLFQYFGIDPNKKLANDGQHIGGILIMKKCKHLYDVINICTELLQKNNLLITDYYNIIQTSPYFKESRHDQSIWSLSRKLLGSVVYKLGNIEPWRVNNNALRDNHHILYAFSPNESVCVDKDEPFWATRIRI